jgi:GntR family transcriptional regulator/MocR family aminotransferase
MLTLQPHGTQPLYRQITETLRGEIAAGTLPAGTRLPSSRQLARDLRVSRITVATAYAELEAEGVLESRAGSGTYVLPPWAPPRPAGGSHGAAHHLAADDLPPWQRDVRRIANPERDEVLGQVLRGPLVPDIVGFSWGAGDPRLLPIAEFRRALCDVLDRDDPAALGPEGGLGFPPLRQWLAGYLGQHGLDVTPDDILITGGTQQTISLVAATLLRPGDRVITEVPTWPGALEAFETAGARVVAIPLDKEGMRLDRLVDALEREQPRLIYTVPTFHNPTGVVMSARRRQAICALAERFGVPVLEDDHVREVRFGNPLPPPLAAFDRRGDVIHAGSFTKSLIPSLRLGYVVARGPLREALLARRRSVDLFGSALMQRTLTAFVDSGAVDRHWRRVSRVYGRRHTAMLRALEQHLPAGARWSGVSGGLVLWVQAPDGISVAALHDAALADGVGFARGAAFFPEPSDQPYLRLNFAAVDESEIERGIAILGRIMHAQMPCQKQAHHRELALSGERRRSGP